MEDRHHHGGVLQAVPRGDHGPPGLRPAGAGRSGPGRPGPPGGRRRALALVARVAQRGNVRNDQSFRSVGGRGRPYHAEDEENEPGVAGKSEGDPPHGASLAKVPRSYPGRAESTPPRGRDFCATWAAGVCRSTGARRPARMKGRMRAAELHSTPGRAGGLVSAVLVLAVLGTACGLRVDPAEHISKDFLGAVVATDTADVPAAVEGSFVHGGIAEI